MPRKLITSFNIVLALSSIMAIMRLSFALGGAGVFGIATMDSIMGMIDNPVTNGLTVIVLPFFLLGLTGLVAAAGLLKRKEWALYLTIAVCAATIVYDTWAVVEIQASAAIGFVIPLSILLCLKGGKARRHIPKEVGA